MLLLIKLGTTTPRFDGSQFLNPMEGFSPLFDFFWVNFMFALIDTIEHKSFSIKEEVKR